jgi:hypothetical protein
MVRLDNRPSTVLSTAEIKQLQLNLQRKYPEIRAFKVLSIIDPMTLNLEWGLKWVHLYGLNAYPSNLQQVLVQQMEIRSRNVELNNYEAPGMIDTIFYISDVINVIKSLRRRGEDRVTGLIRYIGHQYQKDNVFHTAFMTLVYVEMLRTGAITQAIPTQAVQFASSVIGDDAMLKYFYPTVPRSIKTWVLHLLWTLLSPALYTILHVLTQKSEEENGDVETFV